MTRIRRIKADESKDIDMGVELKRIEGKKPRARTDKLLIQELGNETLVYDLSSNRAHCLNQTAALVWKHCDGETSVDQLVRVLGREAEASVEPAVVSMALDQLSNANLLEERPRNLLGVSGMTRREMMRRVGTAAAVGLPLVSSIVVPEAIQAATCLPTGSACTTSAQCCVPICNAGRCG